MNVKPLRSSMIVAAASLLALTASEAQVQRTAKGEVDNMLLNGAELKENPNLQDVLQQAEHSVQQGRYDLACVLWQKVIDENHGQVFSRDEWMESTARNSYQKYRSVSGDIELTLAALPPEALTTYRRKADGEALALITAAGPENRERALSEVVSRYFLSKPGDEAAFELACLRLDRQEFLSAARLLTKILNEYPDPTVRLGEIQIRLAAVHARVGDGKLARELMAKLKAQDVPPLPMVVLNLVEKDIEDQLAKRTLSIVPKSAWTMAQGGPRRRGLMSAPPKGLTSGLIQDWVQAHTLTLPNTPEWDSMRQGAEEVARKKAESGLGKENLNGVNSRRARGVNGTNLMSNREVIKEWRTNGWQPFGQVNSLSAKSEFAQDTLNKWKVGGWRPVGQVLMSEGRVYFKTHDRVVCCDADSGELQWFGHLNEYPKSPLGVSLSPTRINRSASNPAAQLPSGEREVINFSDALNQSMSIIGDKLAVIQGLPIDFDLTEVKEVPSRDPQFSRASFALSLGRARDNHLFVHNAKSGRLLWMLQPDKLMPDSLGRLAFAGAAVPYGSLMIVPVYESTSLWLFGLDSDSGKVLWRSFLADEPRGQTSQYSPVKIAVDGGEAFVATGAGLIASVDAIGGTLNWAVAYPRTTLNGAELKRYDLNSARLGKKPMTLLDGWDDDTIISSGDTLVLAPSDFNFMVALDRRSGRVLWDTARTPSKGAPASEYVLGISGDVVCVAGKEVVRGYALKDGRTLWERKLGEMSSGRGMLTMDGIYLPLGKSILHLSNLNGETISEIPVAHSNSAQILGSLFTDGEHIFEVGFRQIRSFRINATDDQEGGRNETISEHKKLANELRELLAKTYGQLTSVTDEKSMMDAGQAFSSASSELTMITEKMQVLGAPDQATKQVIKQMFVAFQVGVSSQMDKAMADMFAVSVSVGQEVLLEVVKLHRKAEELPVLHQYGIDLSLGDRK